jgi:flagellum-specific peptidoglycan hydrolase FlgJ
MIAVAEQVFLNSAGAAAQLTQAKYGVPASITIAQAILESGWGKSGLSVQANNYFGVKAVQGQDYVDFRTTEYYHGVKTIVMAEFAKYHTIADSFDAHAKLLATLSRYAPAMKVAHDPAAFAAAIKAGGYSTAADYPQELMQLVNEFQLSKWDSCPVSANPDTK